MPNATSTTRKVPREELPQRPVWWSGRIVLSSPRKLLLPNVSTYRYLHPHEDFMDAKHPGEVVSETAAVAAGMDARVASSKLGAHESAAASCDAHAANDAKRRKGKLSCLAPVGDAVAPEQVKPTETKKRMARDCGAGEAAMEVKTAQSVGKDGKDGVAAPNEQTAHTGRVQVDHASPNAKDRDTATGATNPAMSLLQGGWQPHACLICSKIFPTASRLRVHQKSHSGHRPFPCDKCNKAFSTTNALKRHAPVHTGEKPFQCEHCGKRFSDPSSLARHERVHLAARGED
jgi:hypothetical protein